MGQPAWLDLCASRGHSRRSGAAGRGCAASGPSCARASVDSGEALTEVGRGAGFIDAVEVERARRFPRVRPATRLASWLPLPPSHRRDDCAEARRRESPGTGRLRSAPAHLGEARRWSASLTTPSRRSCSAPRPGHCPARRAGRRRTRRDAATDMEALRTMASSGCAGSCRADSRRWPCWLQAGCVRLIVAMGHRRGAAGRAFRRRSAGRRR
jgi:hypothetical protein